MNNPYYFTDGNLKIGFQINLDSHNFNHANSISSIIPIYMNVGVEKRYVKES